MSSVTPHLLLRLQSSREAVLALDPGETTGWALFVNGRLSRCRQIPPLASRKPDLQRAASLLQKLNQLYTGKLPITVVMERFSLYGHKAKQQIGSTFPTVEVIGIIRFTCQQLGLRVVEQSASQAKSFVSDDRLRAMQLWQVNQRHSRDAIRHALYYILASKRSVRTSTKA